MACDNICFPLHAGRMNGLFPAVLMPMLGADYNKWVTAMIAIAVLAMLLTIVEYYLNP